VDTNDLYTENIDYSAVCHEFMSFNKTNNLWGTCAVMDCSQMENLASAVKAKLSEWQDALSSVSMQNVQQYGAYGWGRDYRYFSYDLLDFFRELGRKSGVKNLDLNEAVSTVQSALNQAVIAKDCLSGTDYEFDGVIVDEARFCGIGMCIFQKNIILMLLIKQLGMITTSNPSLGIMRQVGPI